jgi:uridine phosphorylase
MSMDANKAIIEPQKAKSEESLPPLCILVFSPRDVEGFARSFSGLRKLPTRIFLAELYVGVYGGSPAALVGPMLGAAQTVLILEKLIALGVTSVIAVGWCGSLQADVRIGDLVLAAGAVSEEGVSQHYPIPVENPGPAPELLPSLREALKRSGVAVHEGPVWSTDAPYRETVGKVVEHREKGVLAVEMETSALFTVARYREIRLAVVLAVSDDLSTLRWRHGFRDPAFQNIRRMLPELLQWAVNGAAPETCDARGL